MVAFCSERCKADARQYHQYECRMKLYEMLHFVGDDYKDFFMAVRTITQRPIDYFLDREQEIWNAIHTEYPEMASELLILAIELRTTYVYNMYLFHTFSM